MSNTLTGIPTAATAPPGQIEKPRPTEFHCYAPSATAVFLAGSFNNWDARATPLSRADDGNWTVVLELAPGFCHYKYLIDGRWSCEPTCPPNCAGNSFCDSCIPNCYGTMDRLRVVG